MPGLNLVLSGGNALGAYHAGVWSALESADIVPDRIAGVSIGAVTAALIAGTAPGRRAAVLRAFWHQASSFDAAAALLPAALRQPVQYAQALSSRLLGRPPLFNLRLPDLTGSDRQPSLFQADPMRRLLTELVDFDRLNGGDIRITLAAIDLRTGELVVLDTASTRVTLEHIMASAALIPDFPPVEIDGRLLVDGGMAANLPLDLVLQEALDTGPAQRVTCFAADLFPLAAPLPRGLLQAAQRQSDLMFASQTSQTLQALSRLWDGREPGADLFLAQYEALADETALKGFDFSAGTIEQRQAAGQRDMLRLVERWRSLEQSGAGLHIYRA